MEYKVEISQKAAKVLDKLQIKDKDNFEKIMTSLKKIGKNPGHHGKPLTGSLKGLWSCRTGSFRIIYEIQKENVIVFIVAMGHRRNIYD
ncbi:type II toxin-antitoxin system RelE/ParE family toxin [Candidatus Woesearchaeota archaeon]|nr:type II toxin-antitoxin system RelE/ParE family toxin [Candidatus Woesearchaeota archaeon]